MLSIQHLDMPNLRGRSEAEKERDEVRKAKSDEEFDFGTTEEVGTSGSAGEAKDAWVGGRRSAKQRLATCRGSACKRKMKPEPIKPRGGRAERGGRLKKDRADQGMARTNLWERRRMW